MSAESRAAAVKYLSLAFVAACLVVGLTGCPDKPTTAPTPAKKTYSREEFETLVVGKSPDEVIAAVGKPDRTEGSEDRAGWFYGERTRDPVTGKTDYRAVLHFEAGKVSRVQYF
jgi:hypothetical protein